MARKGTLGRVGASALFGWTAAQRRAADRWHDARRQTEYLFPRATMEGRATRRALEDLGDGTDVLVELAPARRGVRWRLVRFPPLWDPPVILAAGTEADEEGALAAVARRLRVLVPL